MSKLKPVVLDFETFWSPTHTLTKMSPIAYVMHPETEIISCAVKNNYTPTYVEFGEKAVGNVLQCIDWSDKLAIAHNMSGFDAMILAWRYGIKPKMWGCTLAMSRPFHAKDAGGSLAALVKHYGIGEKDNTALVNTKGRHLKDFTPEEIEAMREYNTADVDQCWALFKEFAPRTSKDEMRLIDMTIRMLVEPQFEVDRELLAKTLWEERDRKRAMLLDLAATLGVIGVDDDDIANEVCKTLGSSARFGKLLEDLGVEVPTKVSPTTGKTVPALAKTDEAFVDLQESENPIVAAAAQARLGVKSTLLETRVEAFLQASDAAGGKLPVTLKYYGADTTGRWSGWAYNPQNLPRIPRDKAGRIVEKPSNALRLCLKAGVGRKVVVADLSGIELRVNHFLWKVPSSMALYQADPEKADLYKEFASSLYDIAKEEVSKDQRQVGKVAHLGLGFGAGSITFQKVAKLMGGVSLSLDESKDVVDKWRGAYPEIVRGWKRCHEALSYIAAGEEGFEIDPWGLCTTTAEGIKTPKGMIRYPGLRKESKEGGGSEWWYGHGRNKARIYAGKVTENIVQHLARCVIADNAIQVQKATGYSPALTVHDELVYVTPEDDAVEMLDLVQSTMRTPPVWWPELITWSEGDIGDSYGQCK
jgi:hypothetical protein